MRVGATENGPFDERNGTGMGVGKSGFCLMMSERDFALAGAGKSEQRERETTRDGRRVEEGEEEEEAGQIVLRVGGRR